MIAHYATSWNGLSLEEVAQAAGLNPARVANHHFYRAFYERLRQTDFDVEAEWADQKRRWTPWIERSFDQRRRENGPATRGISIGAGLGIVEEPLLRVGYPLVLHECQAESFEYLRHRNVPFEQVIGENLSAVPSESFDIAFMLTISYVLAPEDYVPALRGVARILRRDGVLVLSEGLPPISKLSGVGGLHRATRRLMGRENARGVFWGWLRTPAEQAAALAEAGFRIEERFFLDEWGTQVSPPLLPLGYALPRSRAKSQWFVARK